jgi:hypothetical protein
VNASRRSRLDWLEPGLSAVLLDLGTSGEPAVLDVMQMRAGADAFLAWSAPTVTVRRVEDVLYPTTSGPQCARAFTVTHLTHGGQ